MIKFNVILFFLTVSFCSYALDLKIACLAPKGTTWAKTINDMGKEIKTATDGQVTFKIYYGGVAGDEPDVLRKIHVKQLHGGIFTGRTLGDIYGDVRVIELPFNFFSDRTKAINTLEKMTPYFNSGFEKNGMKNLGFFELGLAYLVSTKKATDLNSLKGVKIWAWEGDELVKTIMESLELVSVQLSLPDVLSSLSSGVVDAAYNSPIGVLALQWQSKVKYLVQYPVAYGISALLIDMKEWKKISPAHQAKIVEISSKYTKIANDSTDKENVEALVAMKNMGIEFIDFPKKDLEKSVKVRETTIKKLKGKLFSAESIKQLNALLVK